MKANRQITLRDLFTHTAGIGYGGGVASEEWKKAGLQGWYFAHMDEPIGETIKRMARLPMDAHPGTKWVYGYNTDILGVVIERASGMPLDQFLKDRIFDPLGMTHTYFYLPKNKASRLAVSSFGYLSDHYILVLDEFPAVEGFVVSASEREVFVDLAEKDLLRVLWRERARIARRGSCPVLPRPCSQAARGAGAPSARRESAGCERRTARTRM